MTEPSEEAFAVAEQIVLGNQGVGNAALIIDAALAAAREDERAKVEAWLRAENGLCDCHAKSETECGCGAWDDWKRKPLLEIADAIARHEHRNPR